MRWRGVGSGCLGLSLVVGLWLMPQAGRGDGKAFARPGFARAEIPEQRALIHWADGVETLVIETAVKAEGTEFAWVVPLPAAPNEVGPVSTGLFPTVQNLFQPRWVRAESDVWCLLLVLGGFLWFWRWLLHLGVPLIVGGALTFGLAFGGAVLFLPALGKAKAKGWADASAGGEGPTVLSRHRAGVFDVAVVTDASAERLRGWLQSNGFEATPDLDPTIEQYLNEGWVFVVARAQRPVSSTDSFVLHPLRFRFPTPTPVYPMRLTGVGNGPVRLDLFVFGPGRAAATGFREVYCARPDYREVRGPFQGPDGLRVRHSELASMVRGASVATKLSARLSPEDMRRDCAIRWRSFRAVGQRVYAPEAARSRALDWGAAVWCVGALVGLVRAVVLGGRVNGDGEGPTLWHLLTAPVPFAERSGANRPSMFSRWDGAGWLSSLLVVAMVYGLLPRTASGQGVVASRDWRSQMMALELLATEVAAGRTNLTSFENPGGVGTDALARVRAEVTAELVRRELHPDYTNVFSGEPMREEASPGNYTIEASTNGAVVVRWHDFDGAPVLR